MEIPMHRFRNNSRAIALGNPAWDKAKESHLIDLAVRVGENDRLVMEDGFEFINFSSCSYLGLHGRPELLEGAVEAMRREKVWDVSISRIRIRMTLLDEVEEEMAKLWRARCICSPTASAATLGLLPLIASGHLLPDGKPPVMVFDKYAHFSMNLIKPICGDETEVLTCPHKDLDYIEDACKKYPRVAYVADGVFSLGGAAPVRELLELQDRYGLFLYFDDSHSLSLYGKHGEGYARALLGDELSPLTVNVVSLCKGFGGSGGVVMLGASHLADLAIRWGGPLAWSQKLGTATMGLALASLRIHGSPLLGELQGQLLKNLELFDSRIPTEQSGDPFTIRLVVVGDEEKASEVSGEIFRRGFYTSPVFFPIVERGKAGLRVMIRADNDPADIVRFCDAIEELVPPRD
ncbi:MAG TPA: 2-amino-3-ketobutyrate CoA ligase [Acidobacteria bacterium]|nr:2-amino-3-ketobutyrate CoA ligase [Acidobacteriota bacterium]